MSIIPVRLGTITEDQVPYWDALDDRVSCGDCAGRSGWMCLRLRVSCFPVGLKHRCITFKPRLDLPLGSR